MRQLFASAFAVTVLALCSFTASGQEYPNKPIHIVVGGGPGGGMDLTGRILGDGLSKALNQPVIIDNKPGASGMVANRYVVQLPADGYTLLVISDGLLVSPIFFKAPGFDVQKDLEPISLYVRDRILLSTPWGAPWEKFEDFVTHAKAHPGKLNHATSGPGDLFVLFMEMIAQKYGLTVMHIGYKTGPAKTMATVTNEVQLNFVNQVQLMPLYSGKRVRPLAITGDHRMLAFPDIPTFKELGLVGLRDNSHTILAAAGTPQPVIAKLYAAIAQVLKTPETIAQIAKMGGVEIVGLSPEETKKYIAEIITDYTAVARKAGIQPQ